MSTVTIPDLGLVLDVEKVGREPPRTIYVTFHRVDEEERNMTLFTTYVKVTDLPQELQGKIREHLGLKARGPGYSGSF